MYHRFLFYMCPFPMSRADPALSAWLCARISQEPRRHALCRPSWNSPGNLPNSRAKLTGNIGKPWAFKVLLTCCVFLSWFFWFLSYIYIYIDFVFFFVLHIFVNAVSTSNIIKCEGFKFSVLPGSCGLSSQLTNPMIIQYIIYIYIYILYDH